METQTNNHNIEGALNMRSQNELVSGFLQEAKQSGSHGVNNKPSQSFGAGAVPVMAMLLVIMGMSSEMTLKNANLSSQALRVEQGKSEKLTEAFNDFTQEQLPKAASGNMDDIAGYQAELLKLKTADFNVSTSINGQAALLQQLVQGMKVAYNNGAKIINEMYPAVARTKV